jgi:lipopolysaccharide/colanic/teichoic acid biosynthesis glycosyltransferase
VSISVSLVRRPTTGRGPHTSIAKRGFDIVVASLALLLLTPLLLVIAALIRLDTRGPVLFRQVRVGRGGRTFEIQKFRTMRQATDRPEANISPTGDPRITRVGRRLRRSYLDELPQLINVLRGEMSLIGPRPETPEFVALYRPDELRVLSVRPGVMGPSTLLSMTEEDRLADADDALELYVSTILRERVSADLTYLDTWSLRNDIRLLCTQVWAIARRQW